jgi:hypothetical protein
MKRLSQPGSLSKTELALRYNPQTTAKNAVRILRVWIHKNPKLVEELRSANYEETCHLLTPVQIRTIYRHLGVP